MGEAELLVRLMQHRTLASAPPAELAWLAAHGVVRSYARGDLIARKGQPIEGLFIVLSGHFAIHVDRGLGPRKVLEWNAGDVSGHLPFSRMSGPPGNAVVIEPTDVVVIDRAHFPELIRECPAVTAAVVHVMVDRARAFTSSEQQDEKMVSLGRIAAGLAHELNNPASAAARSAKLLSGAIAEAEEASRATARAELTDAQLDAIDRLRRACAAVPPAPLTPLDRADREEELASWLEAHGVETRVAASLVDTSASVEALDALAAFVTGPNLDAVVRWVAACCTIRMLAIDVERAAARVSELVGAVKRFTFMDRRQAPDAVALAPGLHDSVALLQHKARRKSVGIVVDLGDDLPPVRAIGSDLNQVWINLIDNAIDAVPESGRVDISAVRQLDFVIVRIADNGPGIPADIRERIFDPFFTTKGIGKGTGLGLEIARRLVRRNQGDIEVESRPGRTEFRVSLPVATEATAA